MRNQKTFQLAQQNNYRGSIHYKNKLCTERSQLSFEREIFKMRIVLASQTNYQCMKDFVYMNLLIRLMTIQNSTEKSKIIEEIGFLTSRIIYYLWLGYGFSSEPQQHKYLSKNERMIYQEKLLKMEIMVKRFKELFQKEKNANIQIRKLYNDLISKYESILDTNELLIKSNQLKDKRNEKQQIKLQFYKKQSQSLKEHLRNSKITFNSIVLNQEQDIAVKIVSPRFKKEYNQIHNNPPQLKLSNQVLMNVITKSLPKKSNYLIIPNNQNSITIS